MRIKLSDFGGIAPRFPDPILKPPYAIEAANCCTDSGRLEGFGAPLRVLESFPESAIYNLAQSLYYYKPADVEYVLSFSGRAFCVQNPLPNDQYKRVYWLNHGEFKYGGMSDVLKGDGPYPGSNGWIFGVPEPTVKPILTRLPYDASVADPEEKDGKIPSYRAVTYCYASQFGELGGMYAPADGSALETIKVYEGDKIRVSNMATVPSGNYAMGNGACKYLFCTDSNGNWRQVARVPLNGTGWDIDPFNMDAAPVATNAMYETPPSGLEGICMSPFGFMYGWKGNTLCVSETLQLHAWNSDNQRPLAHNIMGVVPTAQGAVVITEGGVFAAIGTDPANITVTGVANSLGCASARSIVDMGGYAMFATMEGIMVATINEAQLVTEDVILRNQFPDYNPPTFMAYRHRDGYIFFSYFMAGFLRADAGASKLMPLVFKTSVQAGMTHPRTGEFVYMHTGERKLYAFDGEDDARTDATWKSTTIEAPQRRQCRWMCVDGEQLRNMRVVIKADGVDITNGGFVPTADKRAYIMLPPYRPAKHFTFEIYLTGAKLNYLMLADSKQELNDAE